MARRVLPPAENAQAAFDAILVPKRTKAKLSLEARSVNAFERVIFATEEMVEQNLFAGANERNLAALHSICHAQVYGVRDEVFETREFLPALSAAQRLVRDDFGGNVDEAIQFVRWVWRREQQREKKRIEDGKSGFRMGWRLVFGTSANARSTLTDYTVFMRRRQRAAGPPAK